MTSRTLELFEKPPRAKPRVLMHSDDHGVLPDGSGECAHFVCAKCGENDWFGCTRTEARRGIPCPKCNDGLSEKEGDK